jgi:hypothetical protein
MLILESRLDESKVGKGAFILHITKHHNHAKLHQFKSLKKAMIQNPIKPKPRHNLIVGL